MHHEDKAIFEEKNDFVAHKSELIDEEEDDLDNLNLDIQQDLVESGEKYLKMYSKKKNKHKSYKQKKKDEVQRLLREIEELVSRLSTDSLAANMHWLDLDSAMNNLDNDQIRQKIEEDLEAQRAREEKEHEMYQKKKDELLNEASERDKAFMEKTKREAA